MKFFVDLLFGLVFSISLGGLGLVFAKRILKYQTDFIEGFFIGCGLCSVVLFVTGMMGLFNTFFNAAFIIVVFLFSIAGRRALFNIHLPLERKYLPPLLLIALILTITALASLAPPIKNDTLYYHLGLPQLWAMDDAIKFYPWLSFSTTALNGEVLLTPIVDFVSPEAAQFFVVIVGVMVMLLLAKGAYKHLNISPALPILILSAVSVYTVVLFDAKNDYLAAGFALMAFLLYSEYRENNSAKLVLLSGIFAGLAASTKSNSLLFAFGMLLMMVLSRHKFKHIILFCLMAFVFGSPWYIKSFIQTGNPVFPFFQEFFNSPVWHDLFVGYNEATSVDSENVGIINFITSPIRLIYWPDIFRTRLGPLPLILLPLLALIKGVHPLVKKALIVSGVFYIFWYISWPMGRYLMPIILLLSLAGAYAIDRLVSQSKIIRIAFILGVISLLAVNGIQIYRDGFLRAKTALGIVDRETYMHSVSSFNPNQLQSAKKDLALPYIDIWNYLNVTAEPDAKVGILRSNSHRADGFYLDRKYIYLNPSGQIVVDFTKSKASIARDIVENDIRYILIDKKVIEEFSPNSEFADAPGFDTLARGVKDFVEITKQNGRLIYMTDRFELYRMKNLSSILKAPFS